MTRPRFICPVCGDLEPSNVAIYLEKLRKQDFAMSPIVPTCKHCASEIETVHSPENAELLILNGTCGSGKSTIAEALMKQHGFAVIDGDCVLQAAKHKRSGEKIAYNSEEALAEIAQEITVLAAFGDKIILSHIILPEDWPGYIALLTRLKLRFRHILLKPVIETAISRCNARTCHQSVTPEYWIRYFHDRLLYEGRSDVTVIDNTDLSVAETIRKML
jgi:gluconate kinase